MLLRGAASRAHACITLAALVTGVPPHAGALARTHEFTGRCAVDCARSTDCVHDWP
eukprot:UN5122